MFVQLCILVPYARKQQHLCFPDESTNNIIMCTSIPDSTYAQARTRMLLVWTLHKGSAHILLGVRDHEGNGVLRSYEMRPEAHVIDMIPPHWPLLPLRTHISHICMIYMWVVFLHMYIRISVFLHVHVHVYVHMYVYVYVYVHDV